MEKNLIDKMVDRFLCWKLPNGALDDRGGQMLPVWKTIGILNERRRRGNRHPVDPIVMPPLAIECDGCGQEKDRASLVCCDYCWDRLPLDVLTAFKAASVSFSGPDPAEVALRQWLIDNRKA